MADESMADESMADESKVDESMADESMARRMAPWHKLGNIVTFTAEKY